MTDNELVFIYERALSVYMKLRNHLHFLNDDSMKIMKEYYKIAHIKREVICFDDEDIYCYVRVDGNEFCLEHSITIGVESTYYSFAIDELIKEIHMLKMNMAS